MPITIDVFSPEALRRGAAKRPKLRKPAATVKLKQQLKKSVPDGGLYQSGYQRREALRLRILTWWAHLEQEYL